MRSRSLAVDGVLKYAFEFLTTAAEFAHGLTGRPRELRDLVGAEQEDHDVFLGMFPHMGLAWWVARQKDIFVTGTVVGGGLATRPAPARLASGDSVQIDREEDAETCRISLAIDGEHVFPETIDDYESVTLTVGSNGEVEEAWVVL